MIDTRILWLTPKRILCPLCGEWHEWKGSTLRTYDSFFKSYEYECNDVTVQIWVEEDFICIYADSPCEKLNTDIDFSVNLQDIEYDGTNPVIKIPLSLLTNQIICKSECVDCYHYDCCNFAKNGDNCKYEDDESNLEFKLEFESKSFNKYSDVACESVLRTR